MKSLIDLNMRLDGQDTWLCSHVDIRDCAAPPSRLSLECAQDFSTSFDSTLSPRKWLRCSECATFWRIWLRERIARPSIEWTDVIQERSPQYRRAPVLDIDRIISVVKGSVPQVIVVQHTQPHLADDEGRVRSANRTFKLTA